MSTDHQIINDQRNFKTLRLTFMWELYQSLLAACIALLDATTSAGTWLFERVPHSSMDGT